MMNCMNGYVIHVFMFYFSDVKSVQNTPINNNRYVKMQICNIKINLHINSIFISDYHRFGLDPYIYINMFTTCEQHFKMHIKCLDIE